MTTLAADWGLGQVFLALLYFWLFFIWIWLLITVFADIFRSKDMGGWGKAAWTIFVIVLPLLGVFVYLIARGDKMHQHAEQMAAEQDAYAKAYIRNAVTDTGGQTAADQLTQLAALKDQGVIDDAEFQRLKAKVTG
jgi:hypothetical protein